METKSIYTVTEAAALLGVTRTRVIQLIGDGSIKAKKIGQMYTLSPAQIEAARGRKTKRGRAAKESK